MNNLEKMNHCINEVILYVKNVKVVCERYDELIKLYGEELTPLGYLRSLFDEFGFIFRANEITVCWYTSPIQEVELKQLEKFAEFCEMVHCDIEDSNIIPFS